MTLKDSNVYIKDANGVLLPFPNLFSAYGWLLAHPSKVSNKVVKHQFLKEMYDELGLILCLNSPTFNPSVASATIMDCASQCQEQILEEKVYD